MYTFIIHAMIKADVLRKARQYETKGNYSAAIEEYYKVIKENPNDANIYNMIGDLYVKIGAPDEALKSYAEAARIYESQELYEYAIAILKKAKRVMPQDRYTYFKLADLYLKLDQVRESQEIIREYLEKVSKGEIFINTEQLYHDLEYILKNFSLDEHMLDLMGKIADSKLSQEQSYYEKIIVSIAEKFEQLGLLEKAREYYLKIPKDSPFYKKIKVKLAVSSQVDRETLNEAIKELKQRIVDATATIEDYKELITLLEKKGDDEEISKYYTDLAEIYYRNGDLKNAFETLILALNKNPQNNQALKLIATIIHEHPEFQSGEYARYLVDLAQRYLELGKIDEAIKYLRMAAEAGYDTESITNYIRILEEYKTLLSLKFRGLPLVKRIKKLVGDDPITGFINPCKFYAIVNEEMAKAVRREETLTFAILNISDFKGFIETYGEEMANNVLNTIAIEIKNKFADEIARGSFLPTRLYDDIFLFMYRGPCFKLKKSLEELVEIIEKKESLLGDYYELRFEAGLVEFPYDATDFQDILKRLEFILTEISLRATAAQKDVSSRVLCLSHLSKEKKDFRIPDFVNREKELDKLLEVYETVSGKGVEKVLFIRGPVGIGKTTLLEEFIKRIEGDKNIWIFKTSLSSAQTISVGSAISNLIRDFIENPTNLELVSSIDEVPPVIAENIPQLGHGVEIQEDLDEDERKLRLISWLEKLVEMFVETGTMLIAIDDLEYIDDLSYSVLLHLMANYKWARIMFIGTYSNESLSEKEKVESTLGYFEKSNLLELIDLKPFTPEKVREYIEEFLLTSSIPEGLVEFVVKETSGIPLFMKELLKSLIEGGELVKRDGKWYWEGRGNVKFTPEIEKIFERKIKKISDDILYILGVASSLGSIFSSKDVFKVISKNEIFKFSGEDLEQYIKKNLELAEQNGFIRKIKVGEDGEVYYQFLNESIRNFVQKKLLEKQTEESLNQLYKTSAAVLEEKMLYGEKDLLPEVASNYMRAGMYDKALYYLISAGQWAEVNGAIKDALNFYDMALKAFLKLKEVQALKPVHESIYIRILENRARIKMLLARFPEAEREVKEILSMKVDEKEKPRFINLLGEIKYSSGNLSEAQRIFDHAIIEAQKTKNILEEGRAHLFKAKILIDKGILSAAADEIKKATQLLTSAHAYDELINIYLITGIFYLHLAKLGKAEKYFLESYKISKSRGRVRQKLLSILYGAKIKRLSGDLDVASAMLSQAYDDAKKLLDPSLIGQILKEEAMIYLFRGDIKNAIVKLENAQSKLANSPFSLHYIEVNLYTALIYIIGGSYSRALKTMSKIQEHLVRCESLSIKLKAYAIKALLDHLSLNTIEAIKLIDGLLIPAHRKSQIAREPAPFIFHIITTIFTDLEGYSTNLEIQKLASKFVESIPICNCVYKLLIGINKLFHEDSESIDDKEIYLKYKSLIQNLAFPKIFYLEYSALLSYRTGDIETCTKKYQSLIEFTKNNGYFFYAERALLNLGKCLFKSGKLVESLNAFQDVLALLKVSSSIFFELTAYYYIIKIYLTLGRDRELDEVLEHYTGIVQIFEDKLRKVEYPERYIEKAPLLKDILDLKDILSRRQV